MVKLNRSLLFDFGECAREGLGPEPQHQRDLVFLMRQTDQVGFLFDYEALKENRDSFASRGQADGFDHTIQMVHPAADRPKHRGIKLRMFLQEIVQLFARKKKQARFRGGGDEFALRSAVHRRLFAKTIAVLKKVQDEFFAV